MKLESFKFQDGKVFRLPEYPEKPKWHDLGPRPDTSDYEIRDEQREDYDKAIAQSLASAIEVAPEDMQKVKRMIWWQHESLDPLTEDWPYDKDKVYSAECEMEVRQKCQHDGIHNSTCIYRQVARLKPKE